MRSKLFSVPFVKLEKKSKKKQTISPEWDVCCRKNLSPFSDKTTRDQRESLNAWQTASASGAHNRRQWTWTRRPSRMEWVEWVYLLKFMAAKKCREFLHQLQLNSSSSSESLKTGSTHLGVILCKVPSPWTQLPRRNFRHTEENSMPGENHFIISVIWEQHPLLVSVSFYLRKRRIHLARDTIERIRPPGLFSNLESLGKGRVSSV